MNKSLLFNNKTPIFALIASAGIGRRMHLNYPKQYYKIFGKTIVEHTLNIFLKNHRILKIIVVLNKNDSFFKKLSISNNQKIKTVIGGKRRSDSVFLGLEYLYKYLKIKQAWVLVHDVVRPCLSQLDLNRIIKLIDKKSFVHGGLLAIKVINTLKFTFRQTLKVSHTINRSQTWHALTPQFFPLILIRNCLKRVLKNKIIITDESEALEFCGYHPKLLKGEIKNLKITTPEDLILARFYLSSIL
ncbi:MAG: 2-C-methyl-D-erythritol 4-phosphate cytidylyltransferase [Arsenophonus sp.]|nr:MAG: 2-C-methyl-D-erythritol 4-phosphate cytidylyltransferase [Arsenophonus sp.]